MSKPAYTSWIDHEEGYDHLYGPDGFECTLTTFEDRIWSRDGKAVVDKLNEQHAEIVRLRDKLGTALSERDAAQYELERLRGILT